MSTNRPPQMLMIEMATGFWLSQCLYVVAKLGIADLLMSGSQSLEQLASQSNSNPEALYRVLRALASVGIFTETESHYFQLTPLASYLQTSNPESLRAMIMMMGEEHYQAWGNLLHSVKTGECAFDNLYKQPIFDYYHQHPEPAEIFNQAMGNFSVVEINAVMEVYDFSNFDTVVDVGGGYGTFLATILQKNPQLKGILFDAEDVISGALEFLETSNLENRCLCVGGNFFESVPAGGNAYLLKHIIHDWGDEDALKILQNCRQAIDQDGKLLLVEQVIPEGNVTSASKFLDINMLVMCSGGKERTETEYQQLLAKAGFSLVRVIPTNSDVSIIEAV
jgi:O-methyltransferase domain/Dimerisation domain